ncbi:MAG: M28 family peptidase [Acidobacteria bacterium]|nr:M28 family peptidase [Acidobacteriota bacterium]
MTRITATLRATRGEGLSFSWHGRSISILLSILVSASLVLAGQGVTGSVNPTGALTPLERRVCSRLKKQTIRSVTQKLASTEMEGRGTATAGGERAARYLAEQFTRWRLKPLGDNGSYLQAIRFRASQVSADTTLRVGKRDLRYGPDFVLAPPLPADGTVVKGELVFVGYGVVSTGHGRDDLVGLDLKDKIVVLMRGTPQGVDEAAWKKVSGRQTVFGRILGQGPAALIITNAGLSEQPYSLLAGYMTRRSVALNSSPAPLFKAPPVVITSDRGAEDLFSGLTTSYGALRSKAENGEFVSQPLAKAATLSVRVRQEEAIGSNVAAVVEGGDPALRDQAVVFSAHYDAFGSGPDGRIYPGAADNALGVGTMLSIAQAFAKSRVCPRRSIIFLAVTGEEHGLLGAEHWVSHPTWPMEKICAAINFDGVGTETYGIVRRIVGFGAEYSDLGETLRWAASATDNIVLPDPLPEEQAFYRSDHYAFVKKGIPALMLMGAPQMERTALISRVKKWLVTDYHQTSDIVRPEWNWEGPRRLAVVGLLMGMRIAAADALPSWWPSAPFRRSAAAAPR